MYAPSPEAQAVLDAAKRISQRLINESRISPALDEAVCNYRASLRPPPRYTASSGWQEDCHRCIRDSCTGVDLGLGEVLAMLNKLSEDAREPKP